MTLNAGRASAGLAAFTLLLLSPFSAAAGTADTSRPRDPSARTRLTPTSREKVLSFWGGIAAVDSSEATASGGDLPGTVTAEDFSPFLLLGTRIEYFPSSSSRLAKHFGIGADITGMIGEVDFPITDSPAVAEVELTAVVIAPSLVIRFPGRKSDGYLGLGVTLMWGSRLSDVSSPYIGDEDTDGQVSLAPSVYAGFRKYTAAGWFFMTEARWQEAENDFLLPGSGTNVHLDWKTFQVVAGTGYRF